MSTYTASGASTTTQGDSYNLTLTTTSTTVTSWLVNWGDGTASHPDIEPVSGSNTTASHPYEIANPLTISATAFEGTTPQAAPDVTVDIGPPSGASQLQVQGLPASLLRQFAGSNVSLARISSDVYDDGASAYLASIDWGDGNTTTGSIVTDPDGHDFDVVGSNAYPTDGNYQPTIIVTHVPDGSATMVQASVVVDALEVMPLSNGTTANLTYTAAANEQLELEEAGPGDLNYHVISGFTPDYSPGAHNIPLNGLQMGSEYNFRLKEIIGGQVQYDYAFLRTTASAANITLAPALLAASPVDGGGHTPISFVWNPGSDGNATSNFTVTVRAYSSAEPASLFDIGASNQTFTITSDHYSLDNQYTVDATLPADADHVEVQIGDAQPSNSVWVPLTITPATSPPSAPALALNTTTNSNGSVTVSLACGTSGEVYGITTSNVLSDIGPVTSSSSLTIAESSLPSEVIVFNGTNYSNVTAIPGTTAAIPSAPTNLAVASTQIVSGTQQVTLVWDDNSDNESSYVVQRLDISVASSVWTPVTLLSEDQSLFTDAPPNANHMYQYRVIAVNAGITSPPSNIALVWFAPIVSAIAVNQPSSIAGSPVTISATATPEVNTSHDLNYEWSLTSSSNSTPITSNTTLPTLPFTPLTAGTWSVSLTVTDPALSLSTIVSNQTFTVVSAPVVYITGPNLLTEGQVATYLANGTALSNVTWSVTYNGNVTTTGSGTQFSFDPISSGAYSIQVTGHDSGGTSHTNSANLTVSDPPPSVEISGPAFGYAGEALTFGSSLGQPAEGDSLVYDWHLLNADGSVYTATSLPDPTDLSTFVVPGSLAIGTYSVSLDVTDEEDTFPSISQSFNFSVLDPSNAGNFDWGSAPTDNSAGPYVPEDVLAQQADGKIIVAGGTNAGFIERLNPDMTLDTSFGPNHTGITSVDFNNGELAQLFTNISAVTINPFNNDIIVVGQAADEAVDSASTIPFSENIAYQSVMAVSEYLSANTVMPDGTIALAGTPDPRFNGGQAWRLDSTSTASIATAVTALSDGSIIVGGVVGTWATSEQNLLLNADVGAYSMPWAGVSDNTGNWRISDFIVVKLTPEGSLDPSFGTFDSATDADTGIAEQGDVTGLDAQAPLDVVTGEPAITSRVTFDFPTALNSLVVLGDGQILAGGYTSRPYSILSGSANAGIDTGFTMARYNANGTLDTSFGSDGVSFTSSAVFNFDNPFTPGAAGTAALSTMKVLSSGEIITAGAAGAGSAIEDSNIYIAKFNANGSLDSTFGTDGVVDTGVNMLGDYAYVDNYPNAGVTYYPYYGFNGAMAFQADGKLVVSQWITSDAEAWEITRLNSNGSLDSTFEDDGSLVIANASYSILGDMPSVQPTGVLLTSDGIIAVGSQTVDATDLGIRYFSYKRPLLVRLTTGPDVAASDLTISSTNSTSADLSWTNTGEGQEGFLIERATSTGSLGTGAVIAAVGANQTTYIDGNVPSPDATYYYQVVPFYTNANGSQHLGNASAPTSVHILPPAPTAGHTNLLAETISLPLDGSTVPSTTELLTGHTYLLVASGVAAIGDLAIDPAYWYSSTDEQTHDNSLSIGTSEGDIATTYGLSIGGQIPYWGTFNADEHTYEIAVTGTGSSLTFALQGLTGLSASGDIQIQLYEVGATTSSTTSTPIREIVSPTTQGTGASSVIQTNTPIQIISANADGSATPWALWLVSSTGTKTLIANGSQSAGQLPDQANTVATINPTLYPNGLYTLQLTASTDPSSSVVDSRTVAIDTVSKAGSFSVPQSDGTINTVNGPVSITRTFDSSRIGQADDFGEGWSLDLINTDLTTTASADTYDPSQKTLHAGDLVYLTVPGDGAHIFEFTPMPVQSDETVGGAPTSVIYAPEFVAVDGSGATLTVEVDGLQGTSSFLTYDSENNQFYANLPNEQFGTKVDGVLNAYGYEPGPAPDYTGILESNPQLDEIAFNPANPNFQLDYQLTTKDGTSYDVSSTTGEIKSVTSAGGSTTNYSYVDGTVTAKNDQGEVLFTINTNDDHQITSIQIPNQPSINYAYSSGNLVSVQNQAGDKTFYAYQAPNLPHYLTGITDAQGKTILQAQYDSEGNLSALINAQGASIPISTVALGANEFIQTSVDALGDVTQEVYDETFDTPVRKIQTYTDADGDTDYLVTVTEYTYVTDDLADTSAFRPSGVQMLQSVRTFASFEVAGADAAGLRYTQQPDPNSWKELVTLDTSDAIEDAGREMPIELSNQTTSNGTLQTTLFSNYTFTNKQLEIARPQVLTTEIQTPNTSPSTGYTNQVQSTTYISYDGQGRIIYSVITMGAYPGLSGYLIATGTENFYDGVAGLLSETVPVVASVSSTGSVSIVSTSASEKQNTYYDASSITIPGVQAGEPGAVYGGLKFSVDAAGQYTYYAYDAVGHPVLQFVYKTWTDADGASESGWVGSTNVYNAIGLLTDTYNATYVDPDPTGEPFLQVIGGSGWVQFDTSYYGNPENVVHTVHNDYDTLNQKIDSIDQYGGTTTYTYDANGNLIRTANPDGTETRSVYDALNRVIWTTTQPFVPANSNLTSSANTAILTHTIYNQLGQVIETDQVQGATIEIVSGSAGSSLIWTSQEVPTIMGTPPSLISSTKTYFDPAGNAIETISPSGLRTGTIYNPDGTVTYTGPLNSSAPDGGHSVTTDGITTSEFTTGDFSSSIHTLYNLFNATLSSSSNGTLGFYTHVIDQNGHHTDTFKDNQGRTVRTVYDDSSFTETLYSVGSTAVTKDQEGDSIALPEIGWSVPSGDTEEVQIAQRKTGDSLVITYDLYDAAGKLIDVWQPAVTDADPASSTHGQSVKPHSVYTYDAAGNNLTQTDPKGNTTSFAYDQNGNQVSQTLPGGQGESWAYNSLGQLVSHVDFDGQTTAFTYDDSTTGQGRPVTEYFFNTGVSAFNSNGTIRTTFAAQATTILYNALGQPSEMDDYVNGTLSRQTTYTYDPITEQVASVASPEGAITYTYDPATGNLLTTSTGNTITIDGYDNQGRLTNVTVTMLNGITLTTPQVTTYGYDAAGNKTSEVLPNGIRTTYTYDDLNRLTGVAEKNSSNVTLFSQSYTLNHNGTRASSNETEVQPGGAVLTITTTWAYDNLGRLTREFISSSYVGGETPPDGLASWISLPADTDYTSFDTSQQDSCGTITLTWDGSEFSTPQLPLLASQNGGVAQEGSMLLTPLAAENYGGNGSDWLLVEIDASGDMTSWPFILADGVFSPDGDGPAIVPQTSTGSTVTTYAYDLASNRVKEQVFGSAGSLPSDVITYVYNSNDELTSQNSTLSGNTTFTYDPNGSMLSQISETPQYRVGLDPTFGNGGTVISSIDGSIQIGAQTTLANGDILVAGTSNGTLWLAEYKADGSLDTSFNSTGTTTANLIISPDAIAVGTDGSIYVLGNGGTLVKFYANGTLNTSFGSASPGSVSTLVTIADAVVVLSNGNVMVAGENSSGKGVLSEYNASTGAVVALGGANTTLSANSTGTGWTYLAVMANGDVAVAGGNSLAEYDPTTGALVTGFNSGAILASGLYDVSGLATLSDGTLVLSGMDTSFHQVLEEFTATGVLRTGFGSVGKAAVNLGDGDSLESMTVLPSGEILLAGSGYHASGYVDIDLAEYKADGTLDTTFGSEGLASTAFSASGWNQANSVSVLPNGEVLLYGEAMPDSTETFLAKYQVSGYPAGYANLTQTTTYTYDVKGKLSSVSVNGNLEASYTYDDQGNRVSETVGGVTTLYLNDTMNPTGYAEPIEAKITATGKPVTTWITGDRVFAQADANGNVMYLLADGHGSTRELTNAQGTVTAAFNYDAFGTALNFNPGMVATPFLFGGDAFYDAPSGLYIHGNGTRDREGFEFIERDFGTMGQGTIHDPLSLHKYLYAVASPVNFVDASGHDVPGAIGGAIGGTIAGSIFVGALLAAAPEITIGLVIGYAGYAIVFSGVGAFAGSRAAGIFDPGGSPLAHFGIGVGVGFLAADSFYQYQASASVLKWIFDLLG